MAKRESYCSLLYASHKEVEAYFIMAFANLCHPLQHLECSQKLKETGHLTGILCNFRTSDESSGYVNLGGWSHTNNKTRSRNVWW